MVDQEIMTGEQRALLFLIDIAQPLISYHHEPKGDLSKSVGMVLESHPISVDYIKTGLCQAKKEKHILLVAHDFWYGLAELFQGRCACEATHTDITIAQEAQKRIKSFAERLITLFDMDKSQDFIFEANLPEKILDWYTNVITLMVNNRQPLDQSLDEFNLFKETVNPLVATKIAFFLRYFYMVTKKN